MLSMLTPNYNIKESMVGYVYVEYVPSPGDKNVIVLIPGLYPKNTTKRPVDNKIAASMSAKDYFLNSPASERPKCKSIIKYQNYVKAMMQYNSAWRPSQIESVYDSAGNFLYSRVKHMTKVNCIVRGGKLNHIMFDTSKY